MRILSIVSVLLIIALSMISCGSGETLSSDAGSNPNTNSPIGSNGERPPPLPM